MIDRSRRRFRAGSCRMFAAFVLVFGFDNVLSAGTPPSRAEGLVSAGSFSAGSDVIGVQTPEKSADPPKSARPEKPANPPSTPKNPPSPPPKQPEPKRKEADSRQVTLFGIIATPNDTTIDPKLIDIEPQLRKLFPHYGFRLIHARGKRLAEGETLECDLEDGYIAETRLNKAVDENGRVELRVVLTLEGEGQIATDVITPPNQLFFCDKRLSDGMTRLLIGVGAR